MTHTRMRAAALAPVLFTTLLAACTPSADGTTAPSDTTSSGPPTNAQTVTVTGLWSGPELTGFTSVAAVWEQQTGTAVDWRPSQDLASDLSAAVQAGDPPDIAVLPNPGLLHTLAQQGALVPLEPVLDTQVTADYPAAWLDLGSDAGTLYGIPYKVSDKSTVWFNPAAFTAAGYRTPVTWDELIALAHRMVADGRTPFSVVAPASPAPGWALTDQVALLVLTGCGPDTYDSWVAGTTPWTDPCITQAFERFDQVVQTPGFVLGGAQGILSTSDSAGAYPLYTDPPTAYLYPMASFAQAFIAAQYPDLTAGEGYDAFPFPAVDPSLAGSVMVGADVVVMMHDTPAARAFMAYLAGAKAQEAWIGLGGFTSVNRSVPLDTYADPVSRRIAEQLADASVVRFGAGDLMPADVQRAWWDAMVQLVADPSGLDAHLAQLTALAGASAGAP